VGPKKVKVCRPGLLFWILNLGYPLRGRNKFQSCIDITAAFYYIISKVSLTLCNVNQQNAQFFI